MTCYVVTANIYRNAHSRSGPQRPLRTIKPKDPAKSYICVQKIPNQKEPLAYSIDDESINLQGQHG